MFLDSMTKLIALIETNLSQCWNKEQGKSLWD